MSIYNYLINQPHVLIAGASGSGKSVVINGMIVTLLNKPKNAAKLILIDPKRVELSQYRKCAHSLAYASDPEEIASEIENAVYLMESRFEEMQRKNLKVYVGSNVYLVIDEYADLITTQKSAVHKPLCRIAQLGRAAKIHLIIATQRPTAQIIDGQIKVNIDCRLALRCPSSRDSQNIIMQPGAEKLPRYGKGLLLSPDYMPSVLTSIPMLSDTAISQAIKRSQWQRGLLARFQI